MTRPSTHPHPRSGGGPSTAARAFDGAHTVKPPTERAPHALRRKALSGRDDRPSHEALRGGPQHARG